MRFAFVIVLVCIITGFIKPVAAQQPVVKNYTVNDGLVSNSVRRIYQDSKGFLWIATWEGLSKYDGHIFTNYTTANGLSHNLVNDFYETTAGLYVALNDGSIDMISGDNIIFKVKASDVVVNRFLHNRTGGAIVSTDGNGLQEFNNEKLISPNQAYSSSTFNDLFWLNDSLLMASGDSSISIFNKNYELYAEIRNHILPQWDAKVYQDSKKRIWVGSSAGLRLLSRLPKQAGAITFTAPPELFNIPVLTKNKINDILEDEAGTMWFATTGGIVKIDSNGSHKIFTVKDGLPSNVITVIFQDKEKNIWFGTATGLSKLVTQSGIRLYPIENGFIESDYSYLLQPVEKNILLVGTHKGSLLFDKITGSFTPVLNSNNEKFYEVVRNSKPTILLGMHNMAIFDTVALQYKKVIPLPLPASSKIIKDSQGNLFLSIPEQLIFVSGKTQQKILDHRISCLWIDKAGYLWAGTWQHGIFRIQYSFTNKIFRIISKTHFLPGGNIRCLYEDITGNMWAGSRYQGVYRFVKNEKDSFTISNFNQSKGLSSNFIKGIREDAHGNYWIAFFQGLDKLIPQDTGFRIFNYSRINNYYTNMVGIETDADRTLWLGTNDGLVQIEDEQLENNPPLPVYITKIFSADSVYASDTNKLQLNYQQNQLSFEFSAPGFINEKQVLYSYRLSGYSTTEWSKASNQHIVSYASLQPGNYIFEVRTLGWNGQWGIPASQQFTINPPFWKTWWFIPIVFFFGLLIIYLFVKWRLKNIRAIAAEKLKVQHLNAEQYKSKLELEQIINYFSFSLIDKNTVEDVLWDVAKNLIGRLGFVDCMMYLWNDDKTKMIQKAGFGPKGSAEEINKQHFDVMPGQGVVGYVINTKEPVLISDTSKDSRYRADEMTRCSEMTVPIIYNNELLGVIDSEHHEKNFFTQQQLQILSTIATLMANKIKSIEADQLLQQSNIEMYSMKEQLSKAKLEALRSQMNPHFIFNCLNSIDNLIQMDEKEKATLYLSKFAKLIRSILENSAHDVVSCWKDMETLKLYLQMEEWRWDKKFSYQITIDGDILNGDYKVPPLVIQPFVENAIYHGLLNKIEADKKLMIRLSVNNNNIHYLIEDNGVGREKANAYRQLNKPAHESMGMQITTDRINLFNQSKNGSVKITDLFDMQNNAIGTRVEIDLINPS